MCGISGIFGRSDPQTVVDMLSVLAHRGPDDEHSVSGINYSLGARRLSIVGIHDGRQPISNEEQTIWAVQNGELYNYPLVYQDLVARGHRLKTHCDTEILPHLYEEYGTDLVKHIDGMFAIAIWDETRKRGFLARDRVGKKPLYYWLADGALYFASEIKALLRIPGFSRKINFQALDDYLSLKHVPNPMSIFEGIYSLPPTCYLTFSLGGTPRIERYWEFEYPHSDYAISLSEDELVDELLALLKKSVKRRLVSEVPVGFFLSGGVDSALSTALAVELTDAPLKTFTLVYSDDSTTKGKDDDRYWARWSAQKLGTEHYEETVDFSDFPKMLRNIIQCFDEPFSGTLSTYYLSKLVAGHVKVAIGGDGADELFGSYLSHRLAFPLARWDQFKRSGDFRLIAPFQEQLDLLVRLAGQEDWSWRSSLLTFQEEEKRALYTPKALERLGSHQTSDKIREDFSYYSLSDPLNRVLAAEFRSLLPDQVLTFVDRLSMAHSLEIRSPYLDTNFVAFIASLPGNMKIRDGETKYLLKKAALRYFPAEMINRKKEGFIMPISSWLLDRLETYVRQALSHERLQRHGIFSSVQVQRLIDDFYRKKENYIHANKLFSLLVFQEWYDIYME